MRSIIDDAVEASSVTLASAVPFPLSRPRHARADALFEGEIQSA